MGLHMPGALVQGMRHIVCQQLTREPPIDTKAQKTDVSRQTIDDRQDCDSTTRPTQRFANRLPPRVLLYWTVEAMFLDSNAAVTNFFSFHGFRGFLREDKSDLFLRLNVLDCGNAITCTYRKFDTCHYGNERCRMPISGGRALCIAFQSLYYLADDLRTCPEPLKEEVITFARLCLCAEHADFDTVNSLAARMFVAVQRWQCRRVFKDEPDGLSFTPPAEERPGPSKLSQFFLKTPVPAPVPSPRHRPKFESRFVDDEPEDDSWGLLYKQPSRVSQSKVRRRSSPLSISKPTFENSAVVAQPSLNDRPPNVRRSQYQQFKGRAKSMMGTITKKTGQ